jgi:hypothetical protein
MRTKEFFCGTKSFSKVAKELGHSTMTYDNDPQHNPDELGDIYMMSPYLAIGTDIVWFSPPCTAFSVASIGKHWQSSGGRYIPKSKTALIGLKLLEQSIAIIKESNPKIWFIENPRGMMRKVIDDLFLKYKIRPYKRVCVSYCQYGDTRMKPTDIWTNAISWYPKKMCKNGDSCHEKQPRGYKAKKAFDCLGKGTQGMKNAVDRSAIPPALFHEIFNVLEGRK